MDGTVNESDWLVLREPIIRRAFILIFSFGFVAGLLRFLFPFQILNLGGTETIIAWGSSLSSLGQVLGLVVLARIFSRHRVGLGVSGALLAVFILATGFSSTMEPLLLSRIAEGAATGLLTIIIIRVSSGFEESRGESVGTLLAAVFLGSALGQGSAGAIIGQLETLLSLTQGEAIMFLGVLTSVGFVLSMMVLIPSISGIDIYSQRDREGNHGHSHIRLLLRSVKSKGLAVLVIVYVLYDFSHGIYTPGLSVLINNNGVPIGQIGLGYLIGDTIWGVSQLYTGRLVDTTGNRVPLVLSLVAKGLIVIAYPYAASFLVLTSLLAGAGLSEGFLEPARNDAAMELASNQTISHSHRHHFLGRTAGFPFAISSHEHEHLHASGSDEIVSVLQTLGIIGFALGSGAGGWLLTQGLSLVDFTLLGGFLLVIAGILSSVLRGVGDKGEDG